MQGNFKQNISKRNRGQMAFQSYLFELIQFVNGKIQDNRAYYS